MVITGCEGVGTMVGIVVGCRTGGLLCRVCRACVRAIVRVSCGAVRLVDKGVEVSPFDGSMCWIGEG